MANSPSRDRLQLVVYGLLVVVLVVALFGYTRHNNIRLDKANHQTCELVSFTRETQRDVVRFLQQTSALLATTSRTPSVRAYFKAQLPFLRRLRLRTEPPACLKPT